MKGHLSVGPWWVAGLLLLAGMCSCAAPAEVKELSLSQLELINELIRKDGRTIFDEESFRQGVISEILTKRYISFRDFFDISRLQPTIHLDSCIYTPSLEVEELVYLSKATISRSYTDSYGRSLNPLTINNILRRLKAFNLVNRDGKYWSGTENLLSDMLKIKKEMPELSPNFAVPNI